MGDRSNLLIHANNYSNLIKLFKEKGKIENQWKEAGKGRFGVWFKFGWVLASTFTVKSLPWVISTVF